MALLNTIPSSKPEFAIATSSTAGMMKIGSGRMKNSATVATIQIIEKVKIHGLRRPPRSATAPNIGASRAMEMAMKVVE